MAETRASAPASPAAAEMILARPGRPGCRQLRGLTALTIRHFAGDTSARAAVRDQGLAWPELPGQLSGQDPYLAWRGPQELIALGIEAAPLRSLLRSLLCALAAGRSATAMAADLSEALAVFELHGPCLDDWLAHLVDAAAIAREPGSVTRCRLADAAVMLLRLDTERVWLAVDRPLAPYLSNWLAYAHEGAFATGR